ncbi:MAG: LptF/LptG family permease [Planctomycetota bacterium]|nr:LptF/LptG family permease [Planctomycetota bacterium]
MRLLDRIVLGEALRQTAFFALVFLGLILVAAATPLLKQGAPPLAVLAFLPRQAALFALLALPLAMVTAILATLGRMREDGELVALRAAGIAAWRVALSTLPLAIALALFLALAVHWWLPPLAGELLAGRQELVSQAVAAQVERRRPILQERNGMLAAHAVEGELLRGVFGIYQPDEGGLSVIYAPRARWVMDSGDEDEPPALALELSEAIALLRDAEGRVATAQIPVLSTRLPRARVHWQDKADAMSSGELLRRLRTATDETPRARRQLRSYERAWHTRLMLPLSAFAFWGFACGLGLAMGRGNRLFAACIGVVTVVGALFPALVLAREVGEQLHIHAGIWVWPGPLAVGALGAWLLWRQR